MSAIFNLINIFIGYKSVESSVSSPLFKPEDFSIEISTPDTSSILGNRITIGSVGIRERDSLRRMTFVNGIANEKKDCIHAALAISMRSGNTKVYYVADESEGFLKDTFVTMQLLWKDRELESIDKLAKLWIKLLNEMGPQGTIAHVCHSRGGLITQCALQRLNAEQRAKIHVVNFGSPAEITDQECANALNIINEKDFIPLMNPKKWSLSRLWINPHETFVASDNWVFEHGLLDKAYLQQISNLFV